MSRTRQAFIKDARFAEMEMAIRAELDDARSLMEGPLNSSAKLRLGKAGYRGAFVTAAHDGLQLWHLCAEGDSISFRNRDWELRSVAICLKVKEISKDEKWSAEKAADAFLLAAKRVGVLKSDLFSSVSDTANTAKKTSRLLLSRDDLDQADVTEHTDCAMHVVNLAINGALGLKKGQQKMSDDDYDAEFPAFNRLLGRMKKLVQWLGDKRVPKRWASYKDGRHVLEFTAVSLTRVAWVYRLVVELIRSYSALKDYFNMDGFPYRSYNLSDEEWKDVADVEAVLRSPAQVAVTVQRTNTPSAGLALLDKLTSRRRCRWRATQW
jgi:hypothetical protein